MTDLAVQRELDERYGRTRNPRARLIGWIVIGTLGAALAGWVAWSTVVRSIDSVDIDPLGFSEVDAHGITVDFQVTLRRGAATTCVIEALDTEHGVVGWRVVEYPASDDHTRRFSERVPTVAEATTGLATSCWIP